MRNLGNVAYFTKHCDFLGALGSLYYTMKQDDVFGINI